MVPLIRQGDLLTVEFAPAANVRAGEIFSYRRGDRIITHRLIFKIARNGTVYFIEKGDNAFFQETTHTSVIGRVIAVRRRKTDQIHALDGGIWKIGSALIVAFTLASWIAYFLLAYGRLFFAQLIRLKFNLREAIRNTTDVGTLHRESPSFLRLTNKIVQMISALTVATITWKESLWRNHCVSRNSISSD